MRLEGLQAEAMEALAHVRMDPSASRGRLEAFVKGRKEWCVALGLGFGLGVRVTG